MPTHSAVIPQDLRCRLVRVLVAIIAAPSVCAPLSSIVLQYRISLARDPLLSPKH